MTRTQIDRSATTALATAPGQRLRADAAAAFDRLNAAYRSRYGQYLSLTDSYRPVETQIRILKDRYTTSPFFSTKGLTVANGGIRVWDGKTWYRKPGQATVATPGYSNHGSGVAVDISGTGGFDGTVYRRLAALAPKYGWTNTEGRAIKEPWHWGFTGKAPAAKKRKPKRLKTLRRGSSGWQVRLLQHRLKGAGLYEGVVDDRFGAMTEAAVKRFQKSRGLVADGVVGPHTWFELAQGAKAGASGRWRNQIAQRIAGLSGSDADGVLGPQSDARLREVQRWLGVDDDGDWGNKTIDAMKRKA